MKLSLRNGLNLIAEKQCQNGMLICGICQEKKEVGCVRKRFPDLLKQWQNNGGDTMYTVTEVAKLFSVSRQTVLKWINNGKIKAVKVVKVYRIPKEEIDRLIDKQRKEDEGK